MSRVINFGEKKEAFERMAHMARIVTHSNSEKLAKRFHLLQGLRDTAREAGAKFSLYSEEKERVRFVTEIVTSFFIEVEGAIDLFEDTEVEMIKRGMLQTLEAEQIWVALFEQRWRQI